MISHKKSNSESIIKLKELHIDSIINQCNATEKEIVQNASQIAKQLTTQRTGWKKMESILQEKQLPKRTKIFEVSKEIHDRFKKFCDTQASQKSRKFSKLLVFNDGEQITDKDLRSQEAFKFFAVNRRDFGSPLKEISTSVKKIQTKRLSCDYLMSPEDTILQDIFAIKSKQFSVEKRKTKPVKTERKVKVFESMEEKLQNMNTRNRIVYAEMMKINPISYKSSNFRKQKRLINSIEKLEQERLRIRDAISRK